MKKQKVIAWLVIVASIGFSLFIMNLIIFHSYLLIKNVTTWEFLSWSKVSYLRDWPKNFGSPFDLGWKANMKLFFCYEQ